LAILSNLLGPFVPASYPHKRVPVNGPKTAIRAATALALCLTAVSCSRSPAAPPGAERLAILRFENLSSDPAIDWLGRALAEVISRDLAAAPGLYALPFERLHRGEAAIGIRPAKAPGISAERSLALGAGANRLGYGEYWVRAGKLEARLTIEDPQRQKVVRVIDGSGKPDNPLELADALAHEISRQAEPYPTRRPKALEAYCDALESDDSVTKSRLLEAAIAGDPDFFPPYFLLSQLTLRQDHAGALALLDRALARRARVPDLERARAGFLAANLRSDSAGALESLGVWSRLTPNDPEVWRALGQQSMAHHQYAQATQAFQKALGIEPEDIDSLNRLGYAAAYSGQLDTAMNALQQYQARRPLDANPLDSMGDVNLLLGRLRDAENFYLQAAKKDPGFQGGGESFKAAMARLMSGDIPGADALFRQFADARTAAKDPLADFRKAQWAWITGRRKEGYDQMAAFARSAEESSARQAYGQLAVWSVALGDRRKAAGFAGKASAPFQFLSQPPAPAPEWAARAERAFPEPAKTQDNNTALAYALVADKEFAEAASVLERLYSYTSANASEGFALMLAWAYLETGKPKEAAALLRFNPLPSAAGVRELSVFDFPRLFYLRGRVAGLAGNPQQAESYYKLFLKLSGDEPLEWGEEERAGKASTSP
jgi:tetratricopeptide (TPR) repeat protein